MKLLRYLGALVVALVCAGAHAHAFLDHADPKVGSTVAASPQEIRLWFSEALEPAFSALEVFDSNGRRVGAERARVDPRDRTQIHLTLPALPPGLYMVSWRVVSVDTHVTQGKFMFRVGPAVRSETHK